MFTCCTSSTALTVAEIDDISSFKYGEVDSNAGIIRFMDERYCFNAKITLTDNAWKLLGAPLCNGEITTRLAAKQQTPFFTFNLSDNKISLETIERISFYNGKNSSAVNNAVCGGAVSSYGISGCIRDVVFKNNLASASAQHNAYGGAIYAKSITGRIINATFDGNTATSASAKKGYGGAIFTNEFNGDIICSKFINNTAYDGGAICVQGAVTNNNVFNCDICSSLFRENRANCGGAIYANTASLIGNIIDTMFIGNMSSEMNGGAIRVDKSFISNICSSMFISNFTAKNNGGALFIEDNWLCTVRDLDRCAANPRSYGDTLFFGNKANKEGGAIYVGNSANIYAAFGDMIFQGNLCGVTFNSSVPNPDTGSRNAIYFAGDIGYEVIALGAFDEHVIRLYDPISSVGGKHLKILLNDTTVCPERNMGTVLFDTFQSAMFFDNAIVHGGTMALHNGAKFGGTNNDGVFALLPDATLRVAYEQERRTYTLAHNRDNKDDRLPKMRVDFPQYTGSLNDYDDVSCINAGELILSGKLHFAIPSNVKNNDTLLLTPGIVVLNNETTRVTLETSKKGMPLEIGQCVVLLSSTNDDEDIPVKGNCSNTTAAAITKQNITYGVTKTSGYLFDIAVRNSKHKLVATLVSEVKPEVVVEPAMQSLTNSYLSGLLQMNYSEEIASTLARWPYSPVHKKKRNVFAWTPFLMPLAVDRCTYETGETSSLRTRATSFIGGMMTDAQLSNGHLRVGQFFDCGIDHYDSNNDFEKTKLETIETVAGKGHNHSYTVGAVARMNFQANSLRQSYCEGSYRLGGLASDWKSDDLLDNENRRADHKISNFICGGYLAIGYEVGAKSAVSADFGGKLLWAHRTGGKAKLGGEDEVSFDALNSVRLRFGANIASTKVKNLTIRLAAAFEREMCGKAKATIGGYSLPASSLKGNSAVGEAQLTWIPTSQKNLAVDLGMRSYAGAREGFSGHIQVSWNL
ncbi:MAG: hypothetical protein LBC42_02815 [Puniceicoccales bacterium]|nr:hypothetical protein [Puniceicoccales bacterium]